MATVQPNYEIKNDNDLGKFLLGAVRDVRKGELDVEKAEAISQLTDKYIKLKIAKVLEAKITRKSNLLEVDSEINNLLIQKVEDGQE